MSNTKESPMSERFHDWLEQCPVVFHRDSVDENSASYTFISEEE